MSSPLKLCWLVWGTETGGVARATLANARALGQLGADCSLLALVDGPFLDTARREGLPVRHLGGSVAQHRAYLGGLSPAALWRKWRGLRAFRSALAAALDAQTPDVLCLAWPDLMPLAGTLCRRKRIALVLEVHSTPRRYPLALNQRLYAALSRRHRVRLLANSDYSARHLEKVADLAVVTPAIDVERFDPAHVTPMSRAALQIPENAIVVGQIARLHPDKGFELLLAATARLLGTWPTLHLLLLGGAEDPAYAITLRERTTQLGLDAHAHWCGEVAEPAPYLAACDLVVNARIDAEPLGLSVLEAMLMAKPVVAHALGGPAETVEDDRTGWHFPEPTVEALSSVLERALERRRDWRAMGVAGRARALAQYAGRETRARHLALLREHAARAKAAA